jgi:hypothetical protein
MILIAALLALSARAEPVVLDVKWLPELGLVTLRAEAARLDLKIEKDGVERTQSFQLEAPIREARSGPWMSQGIVIAVSSEADETTTYRYFLSSKVPTGRPTLGSVDFAMDHPLWFLSKPIFTSTGERYRIVAVNDHRGAGDALEITFRRGWMKHSAEMGNIDEKILFDSCGGAWSGETLVEGKAVLFESSNLRRDGGGSPR